MKTAPLILRTENGRPLISNSEPWPEERVEKHMKRRLWRLWWKKNKVKCITGGSALVVSIPVIAFVVFYIRDLR